MALEGYFDSERTALPAPYVEGYIHFPRLGTVDTVHFLIDTGADFTSLHPDDVSRLGIDYRRLAGSSLISAIGIGGATGYYREPAWLLFKESTGADRICQLDVRICEMTDDPAMQDLPSLLGRDFLNLCDIRLNRSQNLVQLEPLNVAGEFILPVPGY